MSRTLGEWRYAARQLRRTPSFTLIAVVTLALGIGASTAVFAVVNALIFRSGSIANLDDVFCLEWSYKPSPRVAGSKTPAPPVPRKIVTNADFRALQANPPAGVVAVAALEPSQATIRIPGHAGRVSIEAVTGGYAQVFGIGVAAGRFIDAADDAGALDNAVLSDRLWREWFNADRAIIGNAKITIDGRRFTVVGVTPRRFKGFDRWGGAEVWVPLGAWRSLRIANLKSAAPDREQVAKSDAIAGQVYLRTRPGAPMDVANAGFRVLYGDWLGHAPTQDYPWSSRTTAARDVLARDSMLGAGLMLLTLSALVLIAACANFANLLYVRGARRAGEVAIRLSLGGRPRDILRLFLTETALLSGMSIALGLLFSSLLLRVTGLTGLGGIGSKSYARGQVSSFDFTMDFQTLLYAAGGGMIAAFAAGIFAAWRASRVPPLQTLASAGVPSGITPRARRWRVALVAVQVTAALLLMMGTGVWVQRLAEQLDTRVLFDTSGIAAARIDLSLYEYNATRGRAFYNDLLARVRSIPGVQAAALADGLPGHAYVSKGLFTLTAEPSAMQTLANATRISGAYAGVSDGFLEALGVKLLRGRPLLPTDRYETPLVAVICESLAARLWPGADPIGKRLMFGNDRQWRTVVGLASDPIRSTKDTSFSCKSCVAFVPWDQEYRAEMLILARSDRPAALAGPIQAAIEAIDPDIAPQDAGPLNDTLLAATRSEMAAGILLSSLGLLALVIAALGVYGVVSFIVASRTREFGIRLALGATRGRVVALVLDHALSLMLFGLLPGVLIASLGSRVLESRVKDLMPNDIPTWIAVPIIVLVIGLIAGYVPARRASRIDPMRALREL